MPQQKRQDLTTVKNEVAKRLRRARNERAGVLMLDNCVLKELPEEIFALTDLEYLFLDGNQLTSIPERLWDLPKLRLVDVTGNPIESLPDRPGLKIDLPIFRRCRSQITGKNFTLYIDPELWHQDPTVWTTELKIITGQLGV